MPQPRAVELRGGRIYDLLLANLPDGATIARRGYARDDAPRLPEAGRRRKAAKFPVVQRPQRRPTRSKHLTRGDSVAAQEDASPRANELARTPRGSQPHDPCRANDLPRIRRRLPSSGRGCGRSRTGAGEPRAPALIRSQALTRQNDPHHHGRGRRHSESRPLALKPATGVTSNELASSQGPGPDVLRSDIPELAAGTRAAAQPAGRRPAASAATPAGASPGGNASAHASSSAASARTGGGASAARSGGSTGGVVSLIDAGRPGWTFSIAASRASALEQRSKRKRRSRRQRAERTPA